MVLDLLTEDLHLAVVEFVGRFAGQDFRDKDLGSVVFDVVFLEQVLFDFAFASGAENFLFDLCMDDSSKQISRPTSVFDRRQQPSRILRTDPRPFDGNSSARNCVHFLRSSHEASLYQVLSD